MRQSWTRYCLRRTQRRLAKEVRRYQLMQVQMDDQLLLLKRLEHRDWSFQEELLELQEIRQFRLEPPQLLQGQSMEDLEAELLS